LSVVDRSRWVRVVVVFAPADYEALERLARRNGQRVERVVERAAAAAVALARVWNRFSD
jgi:acyl-CoA synthetase (NDP forming)